MPIDAITNSLINQTSSAANTSSASQTNMFSDLLSSYMSLSAATSLGSLTGSSSSSSSYMDGIMGLGSSGSLFGLGSGSSDILTMILLMYLINQQGANNSSNTAANTSANTTAQQYCNHTFVDAYTKTASYGIPSQAWLEANPSLTNHIGERDAAVYRSVIDQFDVENNARYTVNKNGTGDTYCNIFAWDVTRAMGAEIPHYIIPETGEPASSSDEGAIELTANAVNDWLNTYGEKYGWRKATAEEAQAYANSGMPAVTSYKNSSGHGHLQVVSPSENGTYDASKGVAIAQAGRTLRNYDHITSVYGSGTLGRIEYFVHI